MLIVDAHLDLSLNALSGRDVLRPAREQAADEFGIPTVSLPDLRAGGVRLICATVFCMPSIDGKPGYRDGAEARAEGLRQLHWYQQQTAVGYFKFIQKRSDLDGLFSPSPGTPGEGRGEGDFVFREPFDIRNHPHPNPLPEYRAREQEPQRALLLLEGADALLDETDVAHWHAAGLRIVGLAWRRTRLSGGTGAPGPLTDEGVRLVRMLDRFGIIHDTSHLAEESFWQLLEMSAGPIIASHSNCRSIVPGDRQLSDAMIEAIVKRDGIVGINFFDKFLLPPGVHGMRRATLTDVVQHMRHVCDLAGDAKHVAIGTDMDGGLGRNEIPVEIETSADLSKLADALSGSGFADDAVAGIMGGNWLRFFGSALPAAG